MEGLEIRSTNPQVKAYHNRTTLGSRPSAKILFSRKDCNMSCSYAQDTLPAACTAVVQNRLQSVKNKTDTAPYRPRTKIPRFVHAGWYHQWLVPSERVKKLNRKKHEDVSRISIISLICKSGPRLVKIYLRHCQNGTEKSFPGPWLTLVPGEEPDRVTQLNRTWFERPR